MLTCLLLHCRLGTHINVRRAGVKRRRVALLEKTMDGDNRIGLPWLRSTGGWQAWTDAQLCKRQFDQFSDNRDKWTACKPVLRTRASSGQHQVLSSCPARRRRCVLPTVAIKLLPFIIHALFVTSPPTTTTSAYRNSGLASFRQSLKY